METLVWFGDGVKDLGDGKIGGYLCRFGSPEQTDLEGDFFTKDTDFGPIQTSLVLYAHAKDAALKGRRLTDTPATIKTDDVGVWIEAQLAQRDDYEKAIYGMVKGGKLGWSSGTASHLVEAERQENGTYWLKSWPLGLDASLTPRPCEPRNDAKALTKAVKALPLSSLKLPSLKDLDGLYDDSGRGVADDLTMGAVGRLQDRLYYRLWDTLCYDTTSTTAEKIESIRLVANQFADYLVRVVEAIYNGLSTETPTDAAEAVKSLMGRRASVAKPATERDFEKALRDAGFSRKEAVAMVAACKSLLRDAGGEGEDSQGLSEESLLLDCRMTDLVSASL